MAISLTRCRGEQLVFSFLGFRGETKTVQTPFIVWGIPFIKPSYNWINYLNNAENQCINGSSSQFSLPVCVGLCVFPVISLWHDYCRCSSPFSFGLLFPLPTSLPQPTCLSRSLLLPTWQFHNVPPNGRGRNRERRSTLNSPPLARAATSPARRPLAWARERARSLPRAAEQSQSSKASFSRVAQLPSHLRRFIRFCALGAFVWFSALCGRSRGNACGLLAKFYFTYTHTTFNSTAEAEELE